MLLIKLLVSRQTNRQPAYIYMYILYVIYTSLLCIVINQSGLYRIKSYIYMQYKRTELCVSVCAGSGAAKQRTHSVRHAKPHSHQTKLPRTSRVGRVSTYNHYDIDFNIIKVVIHCSTFSLIQSICTKTYIPKPHIHYYTHLCDNVFSRFYLYIEYI